MRTRSLVLLSCTSLVLLSLAGRAAARRLGGGAWSSRPRLADVDKSLHTIEDVERKTPRDRWDPDYVVATVGRDPQTLFEWVRDNTIWISYHGALRGPVGVLMDRQGNSLDRALLLATLLEAAGHTVRLAHGDLGRDKAADLLSSLITDHAVALADARAGRSDPKASLATASAYFRVSGAADQLATQDQSLSRVSATLKARVADQVERLVREVKRPSASTEWSKRFERAVGALRDHWWVQRQDGDAWTDLDVLDTNDSSSSTTAPATETLRLADVAAAPLHHEIAMRVIAEQWANGKVAERQALERVIRPDEVIDKPIVLQFWPMDWMRDSIQRTVPDVQQGTVADQRAWSVTLIVGRDVVGTTALLDNGEDIDAPQKTGPMGGLGAAIANAFGGAKPDGDAHQELSAVWLEYEIRVPGEEPRRYRRTVFDLIGPAARGATRTPALAIDETKRMTRALSLTMRTEILPVNCWVAPEFVRHLAAESMLGNRDLFRAAASNATAPTPAVADSLLAHSPPAVTPLYALALERFELSDDANLIYIDQPNVLTRHLYPVKTASAMTFRDATDIVANDVGVSLLARDAFRVHAAHGVLDTNLESLLRVGGGAFGNAGDAFAVPRNWVTLASADESAVARIKLSDDVRDRIRTDLGAGYVVVAPETAVPARPRPFAGWWRINPATGDVLGLGEDGWGQTAVERGAEDTRAKLTSKDYIAMARRFGRGFSESYIFCFGVQMDQMHGMELEPRLWAAIEQSPKNCAAQSAIWGGVSAVAPLVFLTLRTIVARRLGSIGSILNALRRTRRLKNGPPPPTPPPELAPAGGGRVGGGGGGGGGGGNGPKGGGNNGGGNGGGNGNGSGGSGTGGAGEGGGSGGNNGPPSSSGPKGEPPVDPHGKTVADPKATQTDPNCAPAGAEGPAPPISIEEATANKWAAQQAKTDALNQVETATRKFVTYREGEVAGWNQETWQKLLDDANTKDRLFQKASDELEAAEAAYRRARGGGGWGRSGGEGGGTCGPNPN